MRAWIVDSFNSPLGLVERPEPRPAEGQVLLRIKATGLNFADLLMMRGTYQETPEPPFSPGLEVAGLVARTGAGVTELNVGDRVAAYVGHGGLAEYAITDTHRCIPLPEAMDDVTAAGFQIAYGTSHLALTRRARLRPGETLAVLGAAGGVGLTAVEIGKALGARVIALGRGADRLQAATQAGADHIVDTAETEDILATLKALGPLDVIYDAIGGEIAEAALRATAPEARHLLIGFASGDLPRLRPNHMLVKNVDVIGVYWGGYLRFAPEVLRESLRDLVDWHSAGRLSPHVSHVLPFEDADKALDLLKSRRATGKIVVTQ